MSTATATRRARTLHARLQRLLPNWAWMLVALAVAILYPYILDQLLAQPDDLLDASIQTLAYIIMALGLNIVVGFAGLLDLGYVAFFAIGAFVMGWLGSQQFPDVADGKGIHILTPAQVGLRLRRARASTSTSSSSSSSPRSSPRCGASSSAPRRCACAATTWPS